MKKVEKNFTKALLFLLIAIPVVSNAQTANTSPLPAGETVIGGHLHAGSSNEVWTDASSLYFNYRGLASATHFWNLGGSTGKPILTLLSSGAVGIGNVTPGFPFDVEGWGQRVKNSSTQFNAYTTFRIQGPSYTNGLEIDVFGNNNITSDLNWSYGGGAGSAAIVNVNPKPLVFGTNNQGRMQIDAAGLVGIGATPTEMLDVNGTARLRGIVQDNAQNKLLVSDANGKVWWRDVNSLPSIPNKISATTSIGVGGGALVSNTAGANNSAFGYQSLNSNTNGSYNTANGYYSLFYNGYLGAIPVDQGAFPLASSGSCNVAVGAFTLSKNAPGMGNTSIGYGSMYAINTGDYNTAIGYLSGPNADNLTNTTALGKGVTTTASNQVRIGNSSVTSIGGQVSWSTLSDGRFKTNIKEDVSGLEFINQLKPVSYSIDQDKLDSFLGISEKARYRDPAGRSTVIRQTGFVAQDVEKLIKQSGYVFHGVEAPQNDKDHYGIRYAEFVVPLVKAVQELSAKVEEQQKMIEALKNGSTESSFKDSGALSDEIQLFQNNPNPFRQDTEIHMNIPRRVQNAVLVIYDLNGKQIDKRTITERGQVITKVEGGRLAAGLYLYTLVADNYVSDAKRMVLTE